MGALALGGYAYQELSSEGHDRDNFAPDIQHVAETGLFLNTEYAFTPTLNGNIYGLAYTDHEHPKNCDNCRRLAITNNIWQSTVMFVNNELPAGSAIKTNTPFGILVMMRIYENNDPDFPEPHYEVMPDEDSDEPRHVAMWLYNGKNERKYELIPFFDIKGKSNVERRGTFYASLTSDDSLFRIWQYVHSEIQNFGQSTGNNEYYGPSEEVERVMPVLIQGLNNDKFPGLSLLSDNTVRSTMFKGSSPNEVFVITREQGSLSFWELVIIPALYGVVLFVFAFILYTGVKGRALMTMATGYLQQQFPQPPPLGSRV